MPTPAPTDIQENLRTVFEQLLGAMCERPGDATVKLIRSGNSRPMLVITVAQVDYGAVLGKHKSMLKALKLLAAVAGQKEGLAVELELDSTYSKLANGDLRRKFATSVDWDSAPFEKLVDLTLAAMFERYQFEVVPVVNNTSKLTVTILSAPDLGVDFCGELESALDIVLNCVGAMQGRRILVEVVF